MSCRRVTRSAIDAGCGGDDRAVAPDIESPQPLRLGGADFREHLDHTRVELGARDARDLGHGDLVRAAGPVGARTGDGVVGVGHSHDAGVQWNSIACKPMGIALAVPRFLVETWDGKGYPHGLAGDRIPLHARIMAVADTYDSITSSRAYRAGRSHEVAMAEIARVSGTQLDPGMVEVFAKLCAAEPEWLERFNIRRECASP